MIENRHAYLIKCHNNFEILKLLLKSLDDVRNDIFVHVDGKVKDFPFSEMESYVKKSKIFFTERVVENWGGYSQIRAEMLLLEAAVRTPHTYYHLISGSDFPLKSQNDIHQFLAENAGKEYIRFDLEEKRKGFSDRVKYFYFFQDKIGRNKGKLIALYSLCERISLCLQKKFGIDRTKKGKIEYYKGTNWFSITHDLALYVVKHKKFIRRNFNHSICADEMFLHTLVHMSPQRDNIVNNCMRLIDWKRGTPYTYTIEDYEELMQSEMLFARKFDENVDMQIVELLYMKINEAPT